jgi:hypothetical protein
MSLQQLLECRFDHGASEVLNRSSQHDSQLSFAMLKSNVLDLLSIDKGLKVDNLWIPVIVLRARGKQEGCGSVSANCVPDNCFECVIDEVASGANLDG